MLAGGSRREQAGMNADDISARVSRLDNLLRDLALEIPNAETADNSINIERTEYLSTLRKALADVEKALVDLAKAKQQIMQ
jgi:hypothetical protein